MISFNSILNFFSSSVQQKVVKLTTEQWIALSKKLGYEGSAIVVKDKETSEVLFNVSVNKKTGEKEAESQGGKPDNESETDPRDAAVRELDEEAGIQADKNNLTTHMTTTGGTTGTPSHQYILPVDKSKVHPKLKEKFILQVWSHAFYHTVQKKWFVKYVDRSWKEWVMYLLGFQNKYNVVQRFPIRRFNTFFLEQNKEVLINEGIVKETDEAFTNEVV
jgi:hypothetical protein